MAERKLELNKERMYMGSPFRYSYSNSKNGVTSFVSLFVLNLTSEHTTHTHTHTHKHTSKPMFKYQCYVYIYVHVFLYI